MRCVGRGKPGWKQLAEIVRIVQLWVFAVDWMASVMSSVRMGGRGLDPGVDEEVGAGCGVDREMGWGSVGGSG